MIEMFVTGALYLSPHQGITLNEYHAIRSMVAHGRSVPTQTQWQQLRQCESSNRYDAVSKSGKYRGAYQFDRRTWASYGNPGDPALASRYEQDLRAMRLYAARGAKPWPYCGKYLHRGHR